MAINKEKIKFLNDAYEAKGGFDDGSYLIKFPREIEEKFNSRKKMAYYINHTKSAIERYRDYMFKKKALRTSKNELVKMVFESANLAKDSIDVVIRDLFNSAFLRGSALVLIDMPKTIPSSLKEQKLNKALPYLVNISPLAVDDYNFKDGKFEWIILSYDIEIKEPFKEAQTVKEYHYYDSVEFQRRDKNKNIIERFTHNLGITPVIALNLEGDLFKDTICYQISKLSHRIYNARSELDEILRGQTFSILAYHAPDGVSPEELKISVDNVLLYQQNAPSFIAPTADSANIYIKQIESLEELINEISLNPVNFSSKSSETGVALKFKFENLNSMLLSYARLLEDFERRVFEVILAWLDAPWDYEVNYPKDFQISNIAFEVEAANALKEFGMPKGWEIAKKKELVRVDLIGLDDEAIDEIYDEINQERELD